MHYNVKKVEKIICQELEEVREENINTYKYRYNLVPLYQF